MTESRYPRLPILVVDDEPIALESLEFVLMCEGINHTILCEDPREVAGILERREVSVILLDLVMPLISGEEILEMVTREYPGIPVIVVTGNTEVETAVKCMKTNAFDYLLKPVDDNRLLSVVRHALEYRDMQTELRILKRGFVEGEESHPAAFQNIITRSRKMHSIFRYIEAIAQTSQPVLITGETGVGKELIANAVHICSGRQGNFVPINIAGLDDNIISDTLFGHIKGAFTSAGTARMGLVEAAAGGTLFLDEIAELSPESQVKLLRLVQEREYLSLGSDVIKRSDTRIIAATNTDLKKRTRSGKFRHDLYYRLQVHHIKIPPLRDRPNDLAPLLNYFLETAAADMGKKKPTIPDELLALLSMYHFPGNVRELKTLVYDAVADHTSRVMSMRRFKDYIRENRSEEGVPLRNAAGNGHQLIAAWDRIPPLKVIQGMAAQEAVRRADGNKSMAAETLGITRQTLSKYLREASE